MAGARLCGEIFFHDFTEILVGFRPTPLRPTIQRFGPARWFAPLMERDEPFFFSTALWASFGSLVKLAKPNTTAGPPANCILWPSQVSIHLTALVEIHILIETVRHLLLQTAR